MRDIVDPTRRSSSCAMIATSPFSRLKKQRPCSAWPNGPLIATAHTGLARCFGATAVASSTASAICSHGPSSAPSGQQDREGRAYRPRRTLSVLAIALLALAWPKANFPMLLWNASPSIPIGLYWATSGGPLKGKLAVIRLPERTRQFAHQRDYLPRSALLIKPVAASAGDTVCRHGARVTVNGYRRAMARVRDGRGQVLPRWHGCIRLTASQIFALAATGDSFDSRYVGPIDGESVLAAAVPIWTR